MRISITRSVSGKINLNFVPRQRIMALFFVLVMIASIVGPTGTIYALYRPDPENSNITDAQNKSKKNKEDPNRPMKQDYPDGMQPTVADEKSASDAKPIAGDQADEFTKKSAPNGEALKGIAETPKITPHELVDKRTATSSVSVNEDGSLTEKQFFAPKHYQKDGKWEVIDTSLTEDKNAGDSGNVFGRAWGNARSWVTGETTFKTKANDWEARFATSNAKQGFIRIGKGNSEIGAIPVNAKEGVDPVLSTNGDGYQVVHYYDLWPGVNVEYILEASAVKENIIIKDKKAANQVSFKLLGAGLEKKSEKEKVGNQELTYETYAIKGALNDEFTIAPANLILNNYGFVSDQTVFEQNINGDEITLSVNKDYLQNLPDNAFPAVIDPSFNSSFGTRAGGNYVSFKSDGYACPSNVCNLYAGTLYDSNGILRAWRGAFHAPYSQFQNGSNVLTNATLHLKQRTNESFWTGYWGTNTFYGGHATCLNSFNCVNTGALWGSASVGASGDMNLTSFYQNRINAGDFGAWVMVVGNEGITNSFKNFDPGTGPNTGSYMSFTYGGPPSAPSIASPTANQVYVDPQASFKVNYMSNPNGSTPLEYEFLVSTGAAASGGLIVSGKSGSLQWTVPDGILQDGSTYYIQARSYDPITQTYSGWGTSIPFRIDMRTGKDKTQTYDSLGPINVDLATGNISTGASSHTSAALGGSLGISMDYNSPLKSRNGLVGEYWNVTSGYSGGAPTSTPNLMRTDQNADFTWDTGSPGSGVNSDWFYTRWTGYFVAPKTGTYQFGGNNDDKLEIHVNNQQLYSNGGCYTGVCWGTTITLQEGQVVPIRMEHQEATGPTYAHAYVKGAVDEQVIPSDWLQTGVRPLANQRGLTGRYYGRFDGTNTFSSGNALVMQRTDPFLSFNWGSDAPVSNGPNDFLVRWTGFITVPVSGSYTFGSRSDDGSKIIVGTGNTVVLDDWTNHGAPATPTWGGTNFTLSANTPTPITIEYYDQGGPASYEFWIKSTGAGITDQITPSDWLSPKAQVLPDGWNLGLDPDGNLDYDHLKANQNSVVLTDSTGSTHEYTWTGSGYKPPVNEDGQLVRNADGTFALQDIDGRTYVFAQDGTLTSVTNPVDDRKPAALQYEYQSLNGSPAHLYRIKDGADSSRMATVYYSGQSECGSVPSGFDANAPVGMICALITNDNRATYFYYVQGQLARVAKPGNELTDYQYQAVTNSAGATIGYRMVSVRDVLTNDAIAAGVRTDDDNVKTQISYDILGRATGVTQPAPTSGASRMQHTIEYLPGAKAYLDENGSPVPGYHGMTKQHVAGATEPNGFSRRVKYDSLFRTIEDSDIAGLTDKTEWDPLKDLVLSSTDETGLKSTTIYDDEDRPTDGYGPAPSAWFGTDRKPITTPTDYTGQVPHTKSSYDENINGSAVAWYDYSRPSSNNAGVLFGAPKLHTTGLNPASPGAMSIDLVNNAPITAGSGMQGIGFSATGKLRLPNGTYWINADTSEGIRVWVDDILVLDSWQDAAYRSITGGSFTVANNAVKRLRIDSYRKVGSTGAFNVWMKQDFGFDWTTNWTNYLKPDYSLSTSTKTYDGSIGDREITTNYGTNPELSLAQGTTVDPTSLNLSTNKTYEQQGATNSLLRQTSKTLPGGGETNYTYYNGNETRDNPCTPAADAVSQAGFLKLKTEADPDGGGAAASRTAESVYDNAGRIVATHYNQDSWTCTTYDTRGRITQTVIPTIGSEAGRTITNNYAVYGDPTQTSSGDSEGSVLTQVDLLGRTIYYHDAHWNETWTGYDSLGNLSSRTSELGAESFVYDTYNRMTQQKLDNVTYAVVSYDQYGRMSSVEYPNAAGQKMVVGRDVLGRLTGQTYYAGGSQTPGSNLIPNASMEQVSGSDPNKPDKWQNNAWGTNSTTFTYLNEGYTGSRSVKTEMTSYTDGDAKWYFDPVTVTGNTTYTFKDYYQSNIATEAVVAYTHQNQTVTYEWLGNISANSNWTQTSFNFTTPATAVQATVYHIVANVGWLKVDDAEVFATNQGSQTVIASDAVTRSQSGQIISGTENGQSKSYTYDKAGRLTNATIGSNTYAYGFGAQDASCASGTNPNSGKNSNRTTQTINSVTTTYCYDYADRLVSSSDPLANSAQYDSHGNTTVIGSGAAPLRLYYDSSDRNRSFEQYDGNGTGLANYYGRDVQGRITYRETDTISNWNWTLTNNQWYGFTGSGGAPSIVRNSAWAVVEKYLQLPGGVLMTIRPPQTGNANKVYSLPNIHGDVMATTDASGTLTGTFRYDPFGNKISATLPDNTSSGSTFGWVGQHEKITEKDLALTPIQMGARVYFPTLGRFAQVDPIEGGSENSYVYPPNPIVDFDLTGQWSVKGALSAVDGWMKSRSNTERNVATGVATGLGFLACVASVGCGLALGVGAGVSAAVTYSQQRYQGGSVVRSLGAAALVGAIDVGVSKVVNIAKIAKSAPSFRSRSIAVFGAQSVGQGLQSVGTAVYNRTYNAVSSAASRYTKSSNTVSLQSSPSSYTWGSSGSLQVRPLPYQGTLRVVNY